MNGFEEIRALLEEKKNVLSEIERVSDEMKYAKAEELIELFAQRGELLESAKAFGEKIDALAIGNEPLTAALKNSCEPTSLSAGLGEIYDVSLRIKAIANRVLREEEGVKEHIQLERDSLLQKIEDLNSGSASVAGSYLRSVQTGVPQGQLGRKPKTI